MKKQYKKCKLQKYCFIVYIYLSTCMPLLVTTGKRPHAAVYQIPILLLKHGLYIYFNSLTSNHKWVQTLEGLHKIHTC